MDRAIPAGSKICAKRAEQKRHDMHRERVRAVKPLVDTSQPYVVHMEHVRNNLKREQKLEERYSEIDRENRILLKKMSEIMTTGSQATPRTEEKKNTPGPMSLNRDARKKELLRITKENQSILRRIQQAQPVYNHVEMEGTHKKNVNYLKNCAEYPLVNRTPRSARGAYGGVASSELVPLGEDGEESRPQSARSFSQGARMPPQPHPQAHPSQRPQENGYMGSPGSEEFPSSPGAARGAPGSAGSSLPPRPPASAGRPATSGAEADLDAEAMIVYKAKTGSAGSVSAEIDFGSSTGDAQVRLRGLTPSTAEGGAR